MADEQPSLLVDLMTAVNRGLQEAASSPVFKRLVELEHLMRDSWEVETVDDEETDLENEPNFSSHALVHDDALIYVKGFQEPIDLIRLRRTIANLANDVEEIDLFLWGKKGNASSSSEGRRIRARSRKAMRSLRALARLLKGHEVPSPFRDALVADDEDDGEEED